MYRPLASSSVTYLISISHNAKIPQNTFSVAWATLALPIPYRQKFLQYTGEAHPWVQGGVAALFLGGRALLHHHGQHKCEGHMAGCLIGPDPWSSPTLAWQPLGNGVGDVGDDVSLAAL